jgi:hypothetical protein
MTAKYKVPFRATVTGIPKGGIGTWPGFNSILAGKTMLFVEAQIGKYGILYRDADRRWWQNEDWLIPENDEYLKMLESL